MNKNNHYIDIIKASAGSGKTYTLTNKYIDLILSGEKEAYKHILAVTFTNKATDEMKSRVIETLYSKSLEDTPNGHLAQKVLTEILHDYSSFSISTIDRFFQNTMRAFAREIGQYASYQVELDTSGVLKMAIDSMMDSLDNDGNEQLLKWLLTYSLEMIESGKSWNIVGELESLSTLFLKEDFKLKKRGLPSLFADKDTLISFRKKMKTIMNQFGKDLMQIGKRGASIISEHQLAFSDFKGGSRSPFFHFEKWSKGEIKPPTATFLELSVDVEKWYTKNASGNLKQSIESCYNAGLKKCVKDAVDLFDKRYTEYCSAAIIRDNIYIIGIFSDIYKYMNEYLKENNVVLLSETADVLNRIIDGNDTPFIYEKIGTRYDHIMLDEFQDTSTLQWNNFKPLISNCIASGNNNLIVGDIKQSIYRWRGSDWKLLDEDIFKSFREETINPYTLKENWRSSKHIVQFNNLFFTKIGELLSQQNTDISNKVSKIYADCYQQIPEKLSDRSGHIKVTYVNKDKLSSSDNDSTMISGWKLSVLSLIDKDLKSLLNVGYSLRDIAILTRTNVEGSAVATKLISLGYEVITEDSLLLGSSECVGKIVSQLKYEIDPDNKINNLISKKYQIEKLDSEANTYSGSLYDLCEEIIRNIVGTIPEHEVSFVNAFLDAVVSYVDRYGSNIRGFVKWWDDSGHNTSISAPQGQDAIRIMTIHKAKGLGFEVVILPFFTERFKPVGTLQPYIWCKPNCEPFSEIGLIPLRASSSLENTIFVNDYREENMLSHIDSINNAYVAFTRAKNELIVYSEKPDEDKNSFRSVSDALYQFLNNSHNEDLNYELTNISQGEVYEIGKWGQIKSDKEHSQVDEQLQKHFVSIPIGDRLKLSLRGTEFFDAEANSANITGVNSERVRGIVLHDILSRIDTIDDLDNAVQVAVSQGELSVEYQQSTFDYLKQLIDNVADRHWFDGTYRSINEISIINTDGSISRPDRVLIEKANNQQSSGQRSNIYDRKVIVIDYKFGEPHSSHRRQIDGYVKLMQKMGYTNVTGEVWYTTK